jgi:RNA polymerase sigma factor (TIGR02999 family)
VTGLLQDWGNGNEASLERLMAILNSELRKLARSYLGHERRDHTLQPTALVNEAYLRLIDQSRISWQNRGQFFGVAAQMMRRILIDYARARGRDKRGGQAVKVALDDIDVAAPDASHDLLAVDEALDELAAIDERQGKIVELRYFAGLSIDETAAALDISPATVKREWTMAKAWLAVRLKANR